MNLTVKTLKGTHFQIHVQPTDSVMAVKQKIEESQGKESYPWAQQLLIHSGKVLKDDTTLADNEIGENGFLVVMLSKNKTPQSASGASSAPPSKSSVTAGASSVSQPAGTTAVSPSEVPPQAPAGENTVPSSDRATPEIPVYDQAASNLVSGSTLEPIVQQLMDMGGGNWDKDTVQRALRAAYNNPERAVEYLYSGIPETAARTTQMQGVNMDEAALAGTTFSGIPNSAPLNMFPQGIPSLGAGVGGGSLDFLRNNPQFQTLRAMVQANPQILQPMLQELSKQNPQLLRLIQEHNSEFLQLINEPVEGLEGDMFDDQADEEMAHSISVTPAEQEAIERLEAMGFDRANVIEAFLACDRNEELAANYLLEHAADED